MPSNGLTRENWPWIDSIVEGGCKNMALLESPIIRARSEGSNGPEATSAEPKLGVKIYCIS